MIMNTQMHPQIARIAATTVLCPEGLFLVNEDGGLDRAEEWEPLAAREMGAPANWAHRCGGGPPPPLFCQLPAAAGASAQAGYSSCWRRLELSSHTRTLHPHNRPPGTPT